MINSRQLSDLAFQRHILVQALIMIDFLLTLTEKSKSQPYYQTAQKALQYPFTLNEEEVSSCIPHDCHYSLRFHPLQRHCDLHFPS